MKQKIVITGPSGSGKTTLVNTLGRMGFPILHETPAEVISEGYDDLQKRQLECIKRQVFKEKNIHDTCLEFPLFFLDRGLGDIIGFSKYMKVNIPKIEFEYDKVFYIAKSKTVTNYNTRMRVEDNYEQANDIFYEFVLPEYKNAIKLPEKNKIAYILKNI